MGKLIASDILNFWFSDEVKPKRFKKDVAFDKQIKDQFFDVYQKASQGELDDWKTTVQGGLALVIVLDQFPRNMFRGAEQSFSTDHQAREVARFSVTEGDETKLTVSERSFLYMPFMHSEDLADQDLSVTLFSKTGLESSLKFAILHRDIVKRFGRFPHRNVILQRDSTDEEVAFLKEPGSKF